MTITSIRPFWKSVLRFKSLHDYNNLPSSTVGKLFERFCSVATRALMRSGTDVWQGGLGHSLPTVFSKGLQYLRPGLIAGHLNSTTKFLANNGFMGFTCVQDRFGPLRSCCFTLIFLNVQHFGQFGFCKICSRTKINLKLEKILYTCMLNLWFQHLEKNHIWVWW